MKENYPLIPYLISTSNSPAPDSSTIMFTAETIILIFLDILTAGSLLIMLPGVIRISRSFDFKASTPVQYALERRAYLSTSLIVLLFTLKLVGVLFFVSLLDGLAPLFPGAMCAVGVISAAPYGNTALLLKLFTSFVLGYWLLLHQADQKTPNHLHTKSKHTFLLGIYGLLLTEWIFQYLYLMGLDVDQLVSCCGTVFNAASSGIGGQLVRVPHGIVLPLFWVFYGASIFSNWKKSDAFAFVSSLGSLIVGTITLISYVSPYIYELPTHQCPFCILQKEYFFIGYVFYLALFSGAFFGTAPFVLNNLFKTHIDTHKLALWFHLLFVGASTIFPVSYFLRNGVGLWP